MASSKHSFRFGLSELLLIIFLAFSGINLAFHSGGFVVNFQSLGFTVFSSLQKGVNALVTGIGNTFNAVHELSRLREENRELTERLKNYEILQRANTDIRKENERLKEQLDFSLTFEEKNYPARIISRNPDSLYSAFTINKGSRHGIKKNMPVLAVQGGIVGLVGKVVTVGSLTSLVMPIYDSKCSVSARIQNTRDIGIVTGDGSADIPLNMSYIKKRVLDELQIGDLIVTSGEGGNYIADIPIGSISEIRVLEYDSSLNIKVAPVIDFSRIEMVIVSDRIELNPALVSQIEQVK
ncbi:MULTISPECIES: rod shape-determining protein MreC [unclassified Treponema]|jgi:rod shape-determining protein MreC|uniref:rod shape-determining protein MreC n=1 Tax=unclassified Treponema TaxID=2638727 RepID=UPI001B0801C5|nr:MULTISPECIES: rod shape-determining protein MreC [unclassified Treponema]MBO6218856.1 rod shape-determining protein MreC [Treponema sp.]MBQ8680621.1 rod shape-determining protein MreC [Treponema sp.]